MARLIEKSAAADAEDAYQDLARHAQEARHIPRSPGEAGARAVLDAAFLVPAARERRFQEAVERVTARCGRTFDVTLTGPWPPYNFVARSQGSAK